MRYPTVLFDLDGTLIDSGAIILASFKHATRTVLEREILAALTPRQQQELAHLLRLTLLHLGDRADPADDGGS